ncbi:MAG: cache domain-containing protein [Leifsonia sp.]
MMTVTTPEAQVAEITNVFRDVFAPIAAWNTALVALLSGQTAPKRASVDRLVADLVRPELARVGGLVVGAGFVAAPGYLSDAPWHLAWWLGEGNSFGTGGRRGQVRRLEAVEDPSAESFRDHTALEWWRVPARTGLRHITGPYVDYLCTDDYTLTLTEPVFVDGTMVGVVGADLYVTDAERVLLASLARIGTDASLVNSAGRVVVSTDPRRATGSLLRDEALTAALADLPAGSAVDLGDGRRLSSCAGTPLAVLTTAA